MEVKKCGDKSDDFLIEAERCVGESKHYEALVYLNKSLCFAPVSSRNFPLIYERRARIYRDLNQLQKCRENIELAESSVSQINSASALDEISQLGSNLNGATEQPEGFVDNDPWSFFRLSHPPHKKLPFVVDCLKAQDTWRYGRCVITTKPLQPGDVVAIEEPFFRMLNKDARYSRCASCMKSNLMSLLPCPRDCTSSENTEKSIDESSISNFSPSRSSSAMFCSTLCLTKAWQRFHQFECSGLDGSLNNDNEYDIMILKTVFEALDVCGSIDDAKSFFS